MYSKHTTITTVTTHLRHNTAVSSTVKYSLYYNTIYELNHIIMTFTAAASAANIIVILHVLLLRFCLIL